MTVMLKEIKRNSKYHHNSISKYHYNSIKIWYHHNSIKICRRKHIYKICFRRHFYMTMLTAATFLMPLLCCLPELDLSLGCVTWRSKRTKQSLRAKRKGGTASYAHRHVCVCIDLCVR